MRAAADGAGHALEPRASSTPCILSLFGDAVGLIRSLRQAREAAAASSSVIGVVT
jgi:hypothetical protein